MERIILKADLILHGRELDSMEKGSIVIENGRILDILPQHALADFPITDACEPVSYTHLDVYKRQAGAATPRHTGTSTFS